MKKRFMSILLTLCMALTLLPTAAHAATKNKSQPSEGWYYLRCMGNYLNIDADGNAEFKTVNPTSTAAVEILSSPSKTTYKIGYGFSTAGLKAVDLTGGIETNINNKITFYIQESVDAKGGGYMLKDEVKIKKGHKFKTAGEAVIIMKYKGKSMGSYWIEVTK